MRRSPSQEVHIAYLDETELKRSKMTLEMFSETHFPFIQNKLRHALGIRGDISKPCVLAISKNYTLSSRIAAQNVAEKIKARFGKKPRILYRDALPKEVLYTERLQKKDQEAAEKIAADPEKLAAALKENDFYFLLGATPETLKTILSTPQAPSDWLMGRLRADLLDLYARGYVVFAKQLAERAGIDLKEKIRAFPWHTMQELHSKAVQDLAWYYPDQYKTLRSPVVNPEPSAAMEKTPLEAALYFGKLELAAALLAHPKICSEKQRQKTGGQLLVKAMIKGHTHLVQKLFASGYGMSALSDALLNDYKKIAGDIVLTLNSDPNFKYDLVKERRIWQFAVENDHPVVAHILLMHPHTNPNVPDQVGRTALMFFAEIGHVKAIHALLACPKTDPNLKDGCGETPLMRAANDNQVESIKALFTRPKTDPNIQDEEGKTALMCTLREDRLESMHALLAHPKIDLSKEDEDGQTALMLAVKNGCLAAVEALLSHPNMQLPQDMRTWKALLESATPHPEIVEILQSYVPSPVLHTLQSADYPIAPSSADAVAKSYAILWQSFRESSRHSVLGVQA